MAHYVDKDALVAEIEKLKNNAHNGVSYHQSRQSMGLKNELSTWEHLESSFATALKIIDTLEVKEENFIWNNARTTVPEDSINQIICIKEDGLAVSTVGKIVNGTIKWAYLDDLLNTNSFNVEVKEVDLEKELSEVWKDWANEYDISFVSYKKIAKHFFELGLKAQKGE